MDAQDFHSIQEAYMEVVKNQQLNEEEQSSIRRIVSGYNKKRQPSRQEDPEKYYPKEQVDIYDIILSYLLDEGYVETLEAAEAIMVSMSEEWRESIVDEFVELNEGIRSTLKRIFGKNEKTKEDQPESRGAYLRRKYNVGPEKSDTSAKRQIIDRSRARAERDERDYGDSRYSKSVAQKSREAYNRYLEAGYSKYGATHTAGSAPKQGKGNKARREEAMRKRNDNT